MRRFSLLLYCAIALAAAAAPGASAEVLFNGSTLSSFSEVRGAAGTVSEVSDPLGSGQTVFKMTVKDSDVYPSSPFSNPRADAVSPAILEKGKEFWMKCKFMLPTTFPSSVSNWMTLLSVAGSPYEGTSPWTIGLGGATIRWQRNSTYGWDIPWEMPLERGRWISILLHEKLEEGGKGSVEMWVNGERITFFKPSSSYNPGKYAETNHLSMSTMDASNNKGSNRGLLLNNRASGMLETATVYFGPLKIGTQRADVTEPTFKGDQISDFALNQSTSGAVTEVADPAGSGETVLKMTVSDKDVYPVTPTSDPRAQLLSPRIIKPGREYWWRQRFYVPSTMPLVSGSGWFQLLELYGPPYNGPAPFSIKIHEESGKNWLQWQRNGTYSWDIPWMTPLETNHWYDLLIHFKFDSEGFVEAWLNGTPMKFFGANSYNPAKYGETTHLAMATRDSTNGGEGSIVNNEAIIQNYRKHEIFETATLYFGPTLLGEDRVDVE